MATQITITNAGGSANDVIVTGGTDTVRVVPGSQSQTLEVPAGNKGLTITEKVAPPDDAGTTATPA